MIRVQVPEGASAKGLVQRLAGVFEASSVSLDTQSGEVRLELRRKSREALVQALGLINDWLEQAGLDSVVVGLDRNSGTLERHRASRERPLKQRGRVKTLNTPAAQLERRAGTIGAPSSSGVPISV
jgi:hypothetical protein